MRREKGASITTITCTTILLYILANYDTSCFKLVVVVMMVVVHLNPSLALFSLYCLETVTRLILQLNTMSVDRELVVLF